MTQFESTLSAARAGNSKACDALLANYRPVLKAHFRLQMGPELRCKESVSDLIQETLCQAFLDLASFRGAQERVFRAWLFRLASRKLSDRCDYWRAGKRAMHREVSRLSDAAEDELRRSYASLFTPSRVAAAREENRRFESAFDRLSEDQKQVISLACFGGLSHKEIGEQMERSETASRMLLTRARARLAMLLAGDEM